MTHNATLLKKIQLSAAFLDEITNEHGFHSAGLVHEGQLLATSSNCDSQEIFHHFLRTTAPLLKLCGDSSEVAVDAQFQCTKRRIFLQRLPRICPSDPYWVIVSMDPDRRAFRRVVERKTKQIAHFLFH